MKILMTFGGRTLDYFWGKLAERRKLLFLGGGEVLKPIFATIVNQGAPDELNLFFCYSIND